MKRNRLFSYLFVLVLTTIILSACDQKVPEHVTGDERTAAEYIISKGYNILSYEGEISRYTLDKQKLSQYAYKEIWDVQEIKPDSYIGEEIVTYGFIVNQHPLDKKYASLYKQYNYETALNVMLSDGKIIGGTSSPEQKDNDFLSTGGYYSLEAKELDSPE